MRQIKFKAKRIDTGEWVYGDLIEENGGDTYIVQANIIQWKQFDVDPDTVSQFTGLVDRNGKEIYEGDILETEQGIAYVIWNDAAFALKSPGSNAVDWEHSSVYEKSIVIGSIHDNHELLNEKQ